MVFKNSTTASDTLFFFSSFYGKLATPWLQKLFSLGRWYLFSFPMGISACVVRSSENACYDKYADNMLFCPLLRAPLPMGTFQWSFMWCRKDSDPAIPLSLIHYLTSISFSPLPNFLLLRDPEHPANNHVWRINVNLMCTDTVAKENMIL